MPPVIAVIAAVAAISVGTTTLGSLILTAVVGSVISFGISAIVGAISKPKTPKASSGSSFGAEAGGRLQLSRNSVESRKVIYGLVRTSGPLLMVATSDRAGKKNDYLHMVIGLAGHECYGIQRFYIDEDEVLVDGNGNVTSTKYFKSGTAYVRIRTHLGSDTQTADTDLISEVSGWTDAHRLRGITYLYVRLRFNRDIFPNGVPQISASTYGKKLYDPRTGLTAWSENSALCVRDYLTSTAYGLGATTNEIDDATFIASANNCEESVLLADSTTQARYTCNGVVDTADKPVSILKDLSTSMAGVIPYVQGRFRCFSGYYTAPTITIDESWLAGDIEVQAKKPRNELFNAVKGVFVDPAKQWQPTDFPIVTNSTYEAQDGGVRIIRDLELPFTTNAVRAQRIAKIALEQGRQGIVVKMPCNFRALQLSIFDTVNVSIGQLGWTSKIFRVVQWELNIDGGFTLTLQEEAAANYDWNNGEETTIDPAPDTNLPDLFTVETPGNPVVTEQIYETTDGSGVKTQAILSWAESPHSYVAEYVIEYKLRDNTDYIAAGTVKSPALTYTITDLGPGVYDFRVKAINVRGVSSEYAETRKELYGLSAPPSDVTGFTINVISNQAHLSWTPHPDLDVRNGGYFRLRWSSDSLDPNWSEGTDISDALPGIATHVTVPAQRGAYMIKAYDSTGHESVNANSVSLFNNADALVLSSAIGYLEYNGTTSFPGTKTNLVAYRDNITSSPTYGVEYLTLAGIGNFDDASGNFDDAGGYFDAGLGAGFVTSAEYIRSTYVDLRYVYTCRLSLAPVISIFDATGSFDEADGYFDDREGLFDGVDRSETYVDFYVKTTSSDPTGSTYTDSIWSDWQKFFVLDLNTRAIWTKAVITNNKNSNSITIQGLDPSIKFPYREERFTSQSILSGGTTLNYVLPFQASSKPTITVNIQSAQSGDTPKITHVVSGLYTGVTVQILNGGSGVARTVDISARGF